MTTNNNNGENKCLTVIQLIASFVAIIILSSFTHWVLTTIYFYGCVGMTLQDLLLSPIKTGSLGCQLVFRGMKYTHNQYLRQFISILTNLQM